MYNYERIISFSLVKTSLNKYSNIAVIIASFLKPVHVKFGT